MTAPGQMFEMETIEVNGVRDPRLEARPGHPAHLLDRLASPRETRLPGLRGRADQLRASTTASLPTLAHRLGGARRPQGRPGGDRHAQPARVGHRLLGRHHRSVPSSCRSTPGGPSEELAYGLADSGARWPSSTRSASSALRPHLDELDDLDHVIVASEDAGTPIDLGRTARSHRRRSPSPSCSASVDPAATLPEVDDRARRRRHDLLHLGHHRASPRARSAPTATRSPT